MKHCTTCGGLKAITEFPVNKTKAGTQYLHGTCRECRRAQCRAWSMTPEGKRAKRDGILRREYGLLPMEYRLMNLRQGFLCAICLRRETKRHPSGKRLDLSVDHDHKTGRVRALLCQGCNVGLGSFRDDQTRLERARQYLADHT